MKKFLQAVLTTVAILAAVAAAAYAVIKYWDKISAFLQDLCPCCKKSDEMTEFVDYDE